MFEWLENLTRIPTDRLKQMVWTLGIIAGYIILRTLVLRLVTRRITDVAKRYIARKSFTYAVGLLALVAVVSVWLPSATGLGAFFGLVGGGLAIALQDPVTSLAGWIYITVRKPFTTGDRVQIGEHRGDVVDISLFQFSMVEIGNWVDGDQSTGRLIHLPNGLVFKQSTSNYTQGFNFIWNELAMTVTFESNWQRAKELLEHIATEHSVVKSEYAANQIRNAARRFMIFYEHLTPIVWTSVADIGVTLTIRYLCPPRMRRSSAARIWEETLRAFADAGDIDWAYPTTRFYYNAVEGKPQLTPGGGKDASGPPPADSQGASG